MPLVSIANFDILAQASAGGTSELWTFPSASNYNTDILADADGNLIVNRGYELVKVAPNGTVVWAFSSGANIITSTTVDPSGNVYCAINSGTSGHIRKISAAGTILWGAVYNPGHGTGTVPPYPYGTTYSYVTYMNGVIYLSMFITYRASTFSYITQVKAWDAATGAVSTSTGMAFNTQVNNDSAGNIYTNTTLANTRTTVTTRVYSPTGTLMSETAYKSGTSQLMPVKSTPVFGTPGSFYRCCRPTSLTWWGVEKPGSWGVAIANGSMVTGPVGVVDDGNFVYALSDVVIVKLNRTTGAVVWKKTPSFAATHLCSFNGITYLLGTTAIKKVSSMEVFASNPASALTVSLNNFVADTVYPGSGYYPLGESTATESGLLSATTETITIS